MKVKDAVIDILKRFLARYNRSIVSNIPMDRNKKKLWVEQFLMKQTNTNIKNIVLFDDLSKSQYKQDLFVLAELNFIKSGFFIEFGAADGVDISNSYILEKEFGWKGILAEPSKGWHKSLAKNRNCIIETDCVWSISNEELDFFEAEWGVLSTIKDFVESDNHKRSERNSYKVRTVSLTDLLKRHNAPRDIDYLSIDTEGSEFKILENFNFDEYNIKIITVEHNNTEMRNKIFELLTKHNYDRKYTQISECDDWYVKNTPHHQVTPSQTL